MLCIFALVVLPDLVVISLLPWVALAEGLLREHDGRGVPMRSGGRAIIWLAIAILLGGSIGVAIRLAQ